MATVPVIYRGGLDLSNNMIGGSIGNMLVCENFEVSKDGGYAPIEGAAVYGSGVVNHKFPCHALVGNLSPSTFANIGSVMFVTWGYGARLIDGNGATLPYAGRGLIDQHLLSEPAGGNRSFILMPIIEGRLPEGGDTLTFHTINPANTFSVAFSSFDFITYLSSLDELTAGGSTLAALRLTAPVSNPGGDAIQSSQLATYRSADYPLTLTEAEIKNVGSFYFNKCSYLIKDLFTIRLAAGGEPPRIGDEITLTYAATAYSLGTVQKVVSNQDGTLSIGLYGSNTTSYVFSAEPAITYTLVNTTTSTALTLEEDPRSTDPVGAIMLKDSGRFVTTPFVAWSRVDLGYELLFKDGGNTFLVRNRKSREPDNLALLDTGWLTPNSIANSVGWGGIAANLGALDGVPCSSPDSFGENMLFATDFNANIPLYSTVVGIELEVAIKHNTVGNAWRDDTVSLITPTGLGLNLAQAEIYQTGIVYQNRTYGGSNNTWGARLSPADVNSADFGVAFKVRRVLSLTSPSTTDIDILRIKIYYRPYSSRIYFRDTVAGTDVAYGDAIWYHKSGGDWATNNASGVLTVYNISSPAAIGAGYEIWSLAGGTGTLYGVTNSVANSVILPSSADLSRNRSRYEFLRANFYGSEEFSQIFGVNGAGYGFSFDGKYLINIRTGLIDQYEKPRHMAYHSGQLALAYSHGEVTFSDVGAPESYAAVSGGSSPVSNEPDFAGGATVVGLGDRINGLLGLQEQSLGVFCAGSISRINGVAGNFTVSKIRPSSGIIEYTLDDVGSPIFCDTSGIVLMTPTDTFGQFSLNYISNPVAAFLSPRLQDSASFLSSTGVAQCVTIYRKKQYRLYFNDSRVLTLTFVGNELAPEFSTQRLPFNVDHVDTWHTEYGDELVLGCCSGALTIPVGFESYGDSYSRFLFEFDRGTIWPDGSPSGGYCVVNLGYLNASDSIKRIGDIKHHIIQTGYANAGVSMSVDTSRFYATARGVSNSTPLLVGSLTEYRGTRLTVAVQQDVDTSARISGMAFAVTYESNQSTTSLYRGGTDASKRHYYARPFVLKGATVPFEINRQSRSAV